MQVAEGIHERWCDGKGRVGTGCRSSYAETRELLGTVDAGGCRSCSERMRCIGDVDQAGELREEGNLMSGGRGCGCTVEQGDARVGKCPQACGAVRRERARR